MLPVPPPDPRCSHGARLSLGRAGGRLARLSALPCQGRVLHCAPGDSPARWGSPSTAQHTPGGSRGQPSWQLWTARACAGLCRRGGRDVTVLLHQSPARGLPARRGLLAACHEQGLVEVSCPSYTENATSLTGRLLSTKRQRKIEPSLLRMRTSLCPARTELAPRERLAGTG